MSIGDNDMMMDLFRSEVESHSEMLSDVLLNWNAMRRIQVFMIR